MDTFNRLVPKIIFEIKGFIGSRLFKHRTKIKIPKNSNNKILLNIGCGNHFTNGWTHLDYYSFSLNPIKFFAERPKQEPEIFHDLREKLNCESNSIDGIYSCHTLEHLLPNHGVQLVREVYRILKPGSYIRLIVPDFGFIMEKYNNQSLRELGVTGCDYVMSYTQTDGHLSTWDEESLTKILVNAGFVDVKAVQFGQEGSDKRLIIEEENRREGSLVIEALKKI